MNAKLFLLVFILFVNSITAQSSRYTFKGTSLDVVTDAVSVGMGESFAANPYCISSFSVNPASIKIVSSPTAFYNYRSQNWMSGTNGFNFISLGGLVNTSSGTFALSYSRFSTGKFEMMPGYFHDNINQTFSISNSFILFKNLRLGVSVKQFSFSQISEGEFKYSLESKNTFLVDFGLLYKTINISNRRSNLEINLGASIQNFGTDFQLREFFDGKQQAEKTIPLPRYFRIGSSSNFNMLNADGKSDFNVLFTAEYHALLNATEDESVNKDYWGAGLQVTINNLFSARIGAINSPENNILFDRAKFLFRYGAGIVFDFERFGIAIPFLVKADYSLIPINQQSFLITSPANPSGVEETSSKNLHAVSITIQYTNPLF